MLNWHDSSCRKPDVVLVEGLRIPTCHACGETGLLDDDDEENTAKGLELRIPQANPSNLDLKWPASVNFIDNDEEHGDAMQTSLAPTQDPDRAVPRCTPMSPYLPLTRSQIRILRLSPGKPEDTLHINLQTMDYAELYSWDYEALSYTWGNLQGDARKTGTVYVGDHWHILKVTENCASALRRLRDSFEPRDLWVDAVCINQNDIAERTHQVAMMQGIYTNATRVLIYLGEDDAVKLEHLFQRRYFSRMWVIQEVEAARSAKVLWASRSLDWSDFHAQAQKSGVRWLRHFDRRRIIVDRHLFQLFIDTVGCEVSDPRDRVFALLGLVPSAAGYGLTPDYSLSLPAVLIGITAHFLANVPWSRVRIFQAAVLQKQDGLCLPSWMPNWGAPFREFENLPKPRGMSTQSWRRWTPSVNKVTGGLWFDAQQIFVRESRYEKGDVVRGGLPSPAWVFVRGLPTEPLRLRYEAIQSDRTKLAFVASRLVRSSDVICKLPEDGIVLILKPTRSAGTKLTGRLVGVGTTIHRSKASRMYLRSRLKDPTAATPGVSGAAGLGDLMIDIAETARSVYSEFKKALLKLAFCKAIISHTMSMQKDLADNKAPLAAQLRTQQTLDFWVREAQNAWSTHVWSTLYRRAASDRLQKHLEILAPNDETTIAAARIRLQDWADNATLDQFMATEGKEEFKDVELRSNIVQKADGNRLEDLAWMKRGVCDTTERSHWETFLSELIGNGLKMQESGLGLESGPPGGFTSFEII